MTSQAVTDAATAQEGAAAQDAARDRVEARIVHAAEETPEVWDALAVHSPRERRSRDMPGAS
jgi:hypothetical protein